MEVRKTTQGLKIKGNYKTSYKAILFVSIAFLMTACELKLKNNLKNKECNLR